jgi:hypothetical protein
MADAPSPVVAMTTISPSSGRLAVLTAYAIAANTIPVPFLPERVLARIRGAIIQDVVSRHGISVTSDARKILAEASADQRRLLIRAAEGVARQILQRLGPLGVLTAIARGFEVYALGHLLDRYFREARPSATVRMHLEEAQKVRKAIDKAVLRALSPMLRPSETTMASSHEDLRDEFTRWVDAALLTSAALPSYVERRLEAAFDQVIAETPGLRDG